MKRILTLLFSLTSILWTSSCKKEKFTPTAVVPRETTTGEAQNSTEDLLKDSTYYYTYLFSLWSNTIPAPAVLNKAYNLRPLTKSYKTAEDVLEYLKNLSPTVNNAPVDRFSFLDRDGTISSELQAGISAGMGIYVVYLGQDLYVSMVDNGSPAALANMTRGYQITRINNRSDLSYSTQLAENFDYIFDAFDGNRLDLQVKDLSGKSHTLQLTRSVYQTEPIVGDTIYQLRMDANREKKVGYLAFNSFVDVGTEQLPNYMRRDFNSIFTRFESQGIEELIVDLRYNGGGIVNTAEFLASMIAPRTAHEKLMFSYKTNDFLSSLASAKNRFVPAYFQKTNTLNIPRVYFLVTSATASASELLINSLVPYMDVQIIGTGRGKTFGKPVGFFGQRLVNDKAEIFVTSFKLVNSQGISDYFEGLTAHKRDAKEDLFKNFGNPEEGLIRQAINHIQTGQYFSTTTANLGVNRSNTSVGANSLEIKSLDNPRVKPDMYNILKK